MEAFIDYLLSEYQLPPEAICHKTVFTHALKYKEDKKTGEPFLLNVINMKICCYDKNHNLIETKSEKFIDDHIVRTKLKKLKNIDELQLNDKFMNAKDMICDYILQDLFIKNKECVEKIQSLMAYREPQEISTEPPVGSDDE